MLNSGRKNDGSSCPKCKEIKQIINPINTNSKNENNEREKSRVKSELYTTVKKKKPVRRKTKAIDQKSVKSKKDKKIQNPLSRIINQFLSWLID